MLPVVMHHGLFGHGDVTVGPMKFHYFRGIDRAIIRAGHPVIVTQVHPTSSIENRARQLKDVMLERLSATGHAGQKVILMAHSMGGLDARYAVANLGLAEHVAAVVTVTTPHRGTPFADWVVKNLGRRMGGIHLANFFKLDLRAAMDLTTDACRRFNETVKDVPGVQYFSVSASRPWAKMPPFALHSHRIVGSAEGDNDGLVSVQSSTWGRHLGTWAADHWHTINRRFSLEFNRPTGDIAPFWVNLLDRVKSQIGQTCNA
jgi:triacylglycerol lipase